MSEPFYYLNLAVAAGAIVLQLASVLLLFLLFGAKNTRWRESVAKFALPLGFLVVTAATILSLFYSELAGFEPCKLCWYQRIFMFAQVLVLGLALKLKDQKFAPLYSLGLSAIGALLAAYQYYGQMFNPALLNCGLVGAAGGCAQRFFLHFGYITIPLLSLTAFLFVIVLMLLLLKQNKAART